MTEYVCTKCSTKQYTADCHSTSPCIECGGRVVNAESDEAIDLGLYNVQEGMREYFSKKETNDET